MRPALPPLTLRTARACALLATVWIVHPAQAQPAARPDVGQDVAIGAQAVYAQALPSVLQIQVEWTEATRQPADPEWAAFLQGLESKERRAHEAPSHKAAGTGLVWDTQGRVLTHTSALGDGRPEASRYQVRLGDGPRLPAHVLAVDKPSGLAVLQIDTPPPGLRPLARNETPQLQVGQAIFVVGSRPPLGILITGGLLGGVHRPLGQGIGERNALVLDAAIHAGNAGAPVLDDHGRLIGLVTGVYTNGSAGRNALGIAVAPEDLLRLVPRLISLGRITRARLGVGIGDADDDGTGFDATADATRPAAPPGLLIASVEPQGPAARAGLRSGQQERITAINGQPIRQFQSLLLAMETYAPGDTCTLDIWSPAGSRQVRVTLGE